MIKLKKREKNIFQKQTENICKNYICVLIGLLSYKQANTNWNDFSFKG